MSKEYQCYLVENLQFFRSSHHHDKVGENLIETDDLGVACVFAHNHFKEHGKDIIVYQPRIKALREWYSHTAKVWDIDEGEIIKQYHKIHKGYTHNAEYPNYVLYIDNKSLSSLRKQGSAHFEITESGYVFYGMKIISLPFDVEHIKIYADWN
jgi:hypothetical protein